MKTFLKFLEQEGLKDVLYTKCWWNKERVPKNKDELRQLAREFGKEKMAWWLMFSSDVSEYAKLDGKALSKKQRKFYSGKKKKHSIKTQIISEKESKKIICSAF